MCISAVAVCVFVASIASPQNLQSFSGTWRVDGGKSQERALPVENPPSSAPQIPPPPPANHEYTLEQIRRTDDVLKISGGEAGTTAVYTIDLSGKQVSDPIPDAPGVVRIASSHWEHGKIVTQWKMQRNGEMFMHGTDTRNLSPDGHLILKRTIASPSHRAEVMLVLDRVH